MPSRNGILTAPLHVGRLAPMRLPRNPDLFKDAVAASSRSAQFMKWKPVSKRADDSLAAGSSSYALTTLPESLRTASGDDIKSKQLCYLGRGCRFKDSRGKGHANSWHDERGPRPTSWHDERGPRPTNQNPPVRRRLAQ